MNFWLFFWHLSLIDPTILPFLDGGGRKKKYHGLMSSIITNGKLDIEWYFHQLHYKIKGNVWFFIIPAWHDFFDFHGHKSSKHGGPRLFSCLPFPFNRLVEHIFNNKKNRDPDRMIFFLNGKIIHWYLIWTSYSTSK